MASKYNKTQLYRPYDGRNPFSAATSFLDADTVISVLFTHSAEAFN